MTGDDEQLETLLRSMPARRASSSLDARLRKSLARPTWHPVRWAVAAVVVLGLIGVMLRDRTAYDPVVPVVAAATPELTTRLICDTTGTIDGGLVVADNRPYNVVRQTTVHDEILIDPKTNARLEVRTPVQRILIVPAEVF